MNGVMPHAFYSSFPCHMCSHLCLYKYHRWGINPLQRLDVFLNATTSLKMGDNVLDRTLSRVRHHEVHYSRAQGYTVMVNGAALSPSRIALYVVTSVMVHPVFTSFLFSLFYFSPQARTVHNQRYFSSVIVYNNGRISRSTVMWPIVGLLSHRKRIACCHQSCTLLLVNG